MAVAAGTVLILFRNHCVAKGSLPTLYPTHLLFKWNLMEPQSKQVTPEFANKTEKKLQAVITI